MISPEIFKELINTYRKGDNDFCVFASFPTECDGIPMNNNIGFWFEVIESGENLVLSYQYDSLTADEPIQTVTISSEEDLENFIEKAGKWANLK